MNQSINPVGDPADRKKIAVIDATKEAASVSAPPQQAPDEKGRTPGLKLFDFLLYPVLTNFGVFAISVGATYLTARGGDRNAAGKLMWGKTGQFFQQRGEWLVNKFKAMGMTHGQADMGKMVFFSFLDGSLMAPLVKMLEDRRETIAQAFDEKMGTKPEDTSIYSAEPKHSWLSVLGGRFATAAIVVPTAVALDRTGLNEKLFNTPGKNVGAWLAKKPSVVKWFGSLDVKELSRIAFFEAFYTSVCTAGLYFSSRYLASCFCVDKQSKESAEPKAPLEVTQSELLSYDGEISTCHQDQFQAKPKAEELKALRLAPKPLASHREK